MSVSSGRPKSSLTKACELKDMSSMHCRCMINLRKRNYNVWLMIREYGHIPYFVHDDLKGEFKDTSSMYCRCMINLRRASITMYG